MAAVIPLNVCRGYARTGFCLHPESCIYAHPPQNPTGPPANSVAPAYLPYPYPTSSYPPTFVSNPATHYPSTISPPLPDGRLSPQNRSYSKSYRRQHEQNGSSDFQRPHHSTTNGHFETDGEYDQSNGHTSNETGSVDDRRPHQYQHQPQGGKYRRKKNQPSTNENHSLPEPVETEEQKKEREEVEEAKRKEQEEQEAAKKKREEEIDAKIELIRQRNAQIEERQQEILKDEAQAKEQEQREKKQQQQQAYKQRNKTPSDQQYKGKKQLDTENGQSRTRHYSQDRDYHRGGRGGGSRDFYRERKDYNRGEGEDSVYRNGHNDADNIDNQYHPNSFRGGDRGGRGRGGRGRTRGGTGSNQKLFDWEKDQR